MVTRQDILSIHVICCCPCYWVAPPGCRPDTANPVGLSLNSLPSLLTHSTQLISSLSTQPPKLEDILNSTCTPPSSTPTRTKSCPFHLGILSQQWHLLSTPGKHMPWLVKGWGWMPVAQAECGERFLSLSHSHCPQASTSLLKIFIEEKQQRRPLSCLLHSPYCSKPFSPCTSCNLLNNPMRQVPL